MIASAYPAMKPLLALLCLSAALLAAEPPKGEPTNAAEAAAQAAKPAAKRFSLFGGKSAKTGA